VPGPVFGWAASTAAVAHVFVEACDDTCSITGADGHHLQRARRLRTGEVVTAADGTGAWRSYAIDAVGPGVLHLVATAPARLEPEVTPQISVAVALTKGGALDDVVAGCTELGVHAIEPVRTSRSVVRWDADRARRAVERWRGIAREAAMQSRRARVPEVTEVRDLAALAGRPGLLVADRSGAAASAVELPGSGRWTVLVGPEGGLSDDDLGAVHHAPRVRAGHFILRAATAPLAVVAALTLRTTTVPEVVN
jgi:16S rRNA (uracil1498-N3)-methyltransferase